VESSDFRWHGRIKPGSSVELRGVNGAIIAQGASSGEVEVSARKTAKRSDPNSVRIDVVEHDGSVTICAVYPDVNGQKNECKPGGEGRSLTIRGTWNPSSEYRALDVVMLNGASFAARVDGPGPCPGEGWQMLAAQGGYGKPGKPGERGERGPPGPVATALEVDPEGMLTLRFGDGSALGCDLYPLLSRLAR